MSDRLKTLRAMLTYKRPDGSQAEEEFLDRFIRPTGARSDDAGNLILRVGDAPVLWAAHTDTVHKTEGRQTVVEDLETGFLYSTSGECLGADDGVGCWLLLQMIEHEVPGLYVFHRAEEVGVIGASFIQRETPGLLSGVDYAIEFDRFGRSHVVTHHGGMRTASDRFASALADLIGLGMHPNDGGSFTDIATYEYDIAECANVSVGYDGHHTAREYCDPQFAAALARSLCAITEEDIRALPVVRDPTVYQRKTWRDYWDDVDDADDDAQFEAKVEAWADLYAAVLERPDLATGLLFGMGVRASDVRYADLGAVIYE